MRLIEGTSLQEEIGRLHESETSGRKWRRGAPEFRRLLSRFLEACNAIQYAHDRGVLHRDLKPANIMLGKHGGTFVVDWGLAKVLSRSSFESSQVIPVSDMGGELDAMGTMTGAIMGTPGFMSPEQARGEVDQLGSATDIFGLGATLYYLLSGRAPYQSDGRDRISLLSRVQRGDFPIPSQVKTGVSRALEAVCLKAMALRPAERYPSARSLADDVERWLMDEPVTAYREPWFRRLLPLRWR
jgi:serine/threonine protein kinase